MLHNLIYLNLQFNYIPVFHRANFLSLIVKKGDRDRFFVKRKKLAPWNDGV